MNDKQKAILVLFIIIVNMIVFFNIPKELPQPATINKIKINTSLDTIDVYSYIKECNIQHPEIVYAQHLIETGHGTSDLHLLHNNLFGMRCATVRPTVARCVNGYSVYECWKHSVHDYAIWQSFYARNLSEQQYKSYLSRAYAEDTNYISKINWIVKYKIK